MALTAERAKYREKLTRRFFVRNHMTLILIGVLLSGYIATAVLRRFGVEMLAVRYALAVTFSYLTFFVLVRIWLGYVVEQTSQARGEFRRALAENTIDAAETAAGVASSGDEGGGSVDLSLDVDEGGAILLLLGLVLLALFGGAAYLVYQAPVILSEAAFQVVLTTLLVRPSRRIDEPGWFGSVLRDTWVAFAVTLAVTVALGSAVQARCPDATKLADLGSAACARR